MDETAARRRSFDPDEVARLETAMWRSYYDRHRLRLFAQLVTLLHRQFGLPWWRAVPPAAQAAIAAAVFQPGHSRADYRRALPYLRQYYRTIGGPGQDPARLADLELEWWIVHREAGGCPSPALERALADLAIAFYGVPEAQAMAHARPRAEAMLERDREASAPNWRGIESTLRESWRALRPE